jgi:hypothetical protein
LFTDNKWVSLIAYLLCLNNRTLSIICQSLLEKTGGGFLTIYKIIKEIATSQNKSIYRIEHDLNFTNGLISGWNKSIPRADNLQKVADYLGVTPQYILNKSKEYTHE